MAVIASDTFSGTAGQELSAYNPAWSKINGASGSIVITPDGRVRPSSTTSAAYGIIQPPTPDYAIEYAATYLGGANNIAAHAMLRATLTGVTCYRVGVAESYGRVFQCFRFVAGSATQIGQNVSVDLVPMQIIRVRVEIEGAVIRAYVNGNLIFNQTDPNPITAAGYAGIRTYADATPTDADGVHMDNYEVHTIGGIPERQRSRLILTPW
jgi:hypothetical protein